MMKQGIEVWIVIPKPLPIFPPAHAEAQNALKGAEVSAEDEGADILPFRGR